MKICPGCSQIADDARDECPWCGHPLSDKDIPALQRGWRRIHDPISPRCRRCQSRATSFIGNRPHGFRVRSTYQCRSCRKLFDTNNYVLTIASTLMKLLKGFLGTPYGGS